MLKQERWASNGTTFGATLHVVYGLEQLSPVGVFAHGAVGRRIDPSWGGPIELFLISRSSQCSTTGVTKAVVCVILSVGWCI